MLAEGAPPVALDGLGFMGAVSVNSTADFPHLITRCVFNRSLAADASAAPPPEPLVGGGLTVHSGRLTIASTAFLNLRAVDGGALALTGPYATATVVQSHFVNNTASRYGGAFYVGGGRLTLDHTIVTMNEAAERGGTPSPTEPRTLLRPCPLMASASLAC